MTVEQLKTHIKKNKITYKALSAKSGIPVGTLKNIFSQCTINPRLDTMQAIEKALGLKDRYDWTDEEKALGVGRRAIYLSEDEFDWLELRSEVIEAQGENYLNTLIAMIKAGITENLKKKQ